MKKYYKCLIIGLCLVTNVLSAQNFKYNTDQFGIEGSLLGGAIVAGTDDASMTYYNPAAIYNITSGVDISLIRPSINSFGFKQFWNAGEQSKINTTFDFRPLQFSFKLKSKKFDFAFLKISKSNWNDQFSAKQEFVNDNIQQTNNFQYQYRGNDNWYGIGTSFELTQNLHFGVSQFVSIVNYSYQIQVLTETTDVNLNPDEPTDYFNSSTNGNYDNVGLITKIGLIYDTEKHDIGLTITTPTYLHVLKGGDFNQSRIDLNSDNTSIDGIIDVELSPKVKSPWEFNLGYSFVLNEKGKLWFNASYHTMIAEYVMAEIQSINKRLEWTSGNKDVFNYGIGYSDQISEKIQLLGGIRMNNFAYENKAAIEGKVRNFILDGNSLQLSLGTKLSYKRHNILLGFDWGTLISVPDNENLSLLENIDKLGINQKELTKKTFNILLTYGFILDGLTKEKTTHNKK